MGPPTLCRAGPRRRRAAGRRGGRTVAAGRRAVNRRGRRGVIRGDGPPAPGDAAAAPYHATVEGGAGGGAPAPAYDAFGWGIEVALARALDRMLRSQ